MREKLLLGGVAPAIQEVRSAAFFSPAPSVLLSRREVPEPGHRTSRGGWIELHGSAARTWSQRLRPSPGRHSAADIAASERTGS